MGSGLSFEVYAAGCRRLSSFSLLHRLLEARQERDYHGRRSFCGQERMKELRAIEAEIRARDLVVLPDKKLCRQGAARSGKMRGRPSSLLIRPWITR